MAYLFIEDVPSFPLHGLLESAIAFRGGELCHDFSAYHSTQEDALRPSPGLLRDNPVYYVEFDPSRYLL
jgi:hypothetical protein